MSNKRSISTGGFLLVLMLLSLSPLSTVDEQDPDYIITRIDFILAETYPDLDDKLDYPPDCTVIRIFKQEREAEIWAKDASRDSLALIMTLPIASMDFQPGPKLKQGDGKTPEGFYYASFAWYSSNWFMWIDLDEVKTRGEVGKGSPFRICLDYPNGLDRQRTVSVGFSDPGGAICVHGNEVSIGCVSFANKDFLPVYAFCRHHDRAEYGQIQFHIFPFRLDTEADFSTKINNYRHSAAFPSEVLLDFWQNLKTGYDLFQTTKIPLKFKTNREYFRLADINENIIAIKEFLAEQGYYSGAADNLFGNDLKVAVIEFQRDNRLEPDGIIGSRTLARMQELGLGKNYKGYIFTNRNRRNIVD